MENLFLFLLRASFLAPFTIGLGLVLKRVAEPTPILMGILSQCMIFGLLNSFHSEIISAIGTETYFIFYTVVEYVSFSMIIYLSSDIFRARLLLLVCALIFSISLTLQIFTTNNFRGDSINIAAETILILINVIYYFYLRLKNVDEQYLYQNPYFWLMTGMLVYLGFTFFFNILVNHVDNEVIKNYYHFSYIGDIIKNCLFAVALLQLPRTKAITDPSQTFNAPKLDLI